jgi:hypothetical protein
MADPLFLCDGGGIFNGGVGIINAVNIFHNTVTWDLTYARFRLGLLLASITFPLNSHLRNTLH